ncbi:MAG TPA: tetratricopeptide repeat protein [Thermoanaerobaculia bacterium]|nr:tetratricopeptide repeat protein [Thermoanaerobaculia bacterium]
MEPRVLVLTLPSLVVLALLVWHSCRFLPRQRALAFWVSVAVYGLLRGMAVAWVTREGLGASLPYQIHDPLLPVFGVSLQEVAGWAIVAYLAWWLGERFARQEKGGPRLFLAVAWGCLFLGAISWAVEAAAIAAGWWHWTVPAGGEMLLRVPWIGLVDWFFVGTDFLLPFLVLTAPALAGRPIRFLSLLLFPLHMASHLWLAPVATIPGFHLVHWLLLCLVVWLALRSPVEDAAFREAPSDRLRWLPALALGIVLIDAAMVELFLVERPKLLASLMPAAGVALQALRPAAAPVLAAAAVVGSLAFPPLIFGAMPGFTVLVLRFGRRNRWAAPALMAALASLALVMHGRVGKAEEDLKRRLDQALLVRDRGDLTAAMAELSDLSRDHPKSHVPRALLGEIQYRTGRLDEARASYEEAVEIKQDFVEGYRYLAVIHLRRGRRDDAAEAAARGLAVAPQDLELRYLQGREIGELWPEIEAKGPAAVKALAGLAFEVGDAAGAEEALDRGIARWPGDRELRMLRQEAGRRLIQ